MVANSTYSEPTWNETLGTYSWSNGLSQSDYPAFSACVDLELEGYTNWRLPTRDEMQDLGNNEIGDWGETNFEDYGFVDYPGYVWWSSNESSDGTAYARSVDFYDGTNWDDDKTSTGDYVTCVRNP